MIAYNNIDPCPADKINLSLSGQFGFLGYNFIIFENNTFDNDSFGIWKSVLPQYIEKGMVTGEMSSEPWVDVGTLERLKLANTVNNEEN